MNVLPKSLERVTESQIRISWSDDVTLLYDANTLRDQCPCASCREKRSAAKSDDNPLKILAIEETRPLTINGMKPVGNYAYSIAFSDGHDTGIFTFELLREVGAKVT